MLPRQNSTLNSPYSEIFQTKLDLFKNHKTSLVNGEKTLLEIIDVISGVSKNTIPYKFINGVKNLEYDKYKAKVQTICYNANFSFKKKIENLINPTNLMFLDKDGFKTKEDAIKYRNEIMTKYNWIIFSNLSLSGIGLHIVISIPDLYSVEDTSFEKNVKFNLAYDYISETYFENNLDPIGKSLTRHSVIASDPSIMVNWNPATIELNVDDIKSYSFGKKQGKKTYRSKKIVDSTLTWDSLVVDSNGEERKIRDFYIPQVQRSSSILYKQIINENIFFDVDTPVFVDSGVPFVEINVAQHMNNKIMTGERNKILGLYTMKLIYTEAGLMDKNEILNKMKSINKKYCVEPLSGSEITKMFNVNLNNWEKNRNEFDLNVLRYCSVMKRVFWSSHCTLTSEVKSSITSQYFWEPTKIINYSLIVDALSELTVGNTSITYKSISDHSKLCCGTISSYFKSYVDLRDLLQLSKKLKKDIENTKATNGHYIKKKEIIVTSCSDNNTNVPFSNETKATENIKNKINECIEKLILEKKVINQVIVSELLHVHVKTIQRNWKYFKVRVKEHKAGLKKKPIIVSNVAPFSNDTSKNVPFEDVTNVEEEITIGNPVEQTLAAEHPIDDFNFLALRYVLSEDYEGLNDWELNLKILGPFYMFKYFPEYKVDKEQVQEFFTLLSTNTRI